MDRRVSQRGITL